MRTAAVITAIVSTLGLITWFIPSTPAPEKTQETVETKAVNPSAPAIVPTVCGTNNPMPQWTIIHIPASDPSSETRWNDAPVTNVPPSQAAHCSVSVFSDQQFDGKYDFQCQDFLGTWHDYSPKDCRAYKAVRFLSKDGEEMDLPIRLGNSLT